MNKSKSRSKLTKRKSEKPTSKLKRVRTPVQLVQPVQTGQQNWRAVTAAGGAQPGATMLGAARTAGDAAPPNVRTADPTTTNAGPTMTPTTNAGPTATTTVTNPLRPKGVRTKWDKAHLAGGVGGGGGKVGGHGRMLFEVVQVPARMTLQNLQDDERLQKAVGDMTDSQHKDKVPLLVDALFAQGTVDIATADFLALVDRIGPIFDTLQREGENGTVENTDNGRIAALMYDMAQERSSLSTVIKADGLQTLTAAQARAVRQFLEANPRLADYVNDARIKYSFGNNLAKNYGGGVFLNGTILMEPLGKESPDIFLRLVLHETGHATFQRAVVPHQLWADESIPEFWDKGTAYDLITERERLEDSDPSQHAARIAEIDELFAKHGVPDRWERLGEDARDLYAAWGILRAGNGEHMLGVDLGGGRRVNDRKGYQAGTFTEFCAESFMHVAKGDLDAHLAGIEQNPAASAEVKAAWRAAAGILDRYARRDILRREQPLGATE